MATEIRRVPVSRIEHSKTFGTWEVLDNPTIEAAWDDGAGQIVGSLVVVAAVGKGYRPGETVRANFTRPNVAGRWVRLSLKQHGASLFSPVWYGVISSTEEMDDGGAGTITLNCTGIAGVLSQIWLSYGRVKRADGGALIDTGFLPGFNVRPGGDRSSALEDLPNNGGSVYVHDFSEDADRWKAREALNYLLAVFARGQHSPDYQPSSDLVWEIDDPQDCLRFELRPIDLNGMTLLDAINAIISQRRGLLWRVSVTEGATPTVTLKITSTIPAALPIGGVTVPAARWIESPDLSTSPFIRQTPIRRDSSPVYDIIRIHAARP